MTRSKFNCFRTSHGFAEIKNITSNPGFLLHTIGKCHLKESEQLHYYYNNINPIYTEYTKLEQLINNEVKQLTNETFLIENGKIINFMFKELETNIIKLFGRRKERGLINGFGSIIKSITGNLDAADEERYNTILGQLSSNQKVLQGQTNEIIYQQQTLTDKFNKELQTVRLDENKLRTAINEVIGIMKQDKSWKALIHTEIQINKILIYIQRLKSIVDNVIKSLEFCSLNQLDITIIDPSSLQNITQNPNILQTLETVYVTCTLQNDKIHILLAVPNYTKNLYSIQQFTPVPYYDLSYKQLAEENNMITSYNNIYISIRKFINNKYCITNYNPISNCINNILNKQIYDDCLSQEIVIKNYISQIPFTNKVIIFSPNLQNLEFNCGDNYKYKQVQGIFINEQDVCTIKNWQFQKYEPLYQEYIFDTIKEIEIKRIPEINKLNRVKLNITHLDQIKSIKGIDNHHVPILYIILSIVSIIIIFILCKKRIYTRILEYKQKKIVNQEKVDLELNPLK